MSNKKEVKIIRSETASRTARWTLNDNKFTSVDGSYDGTNKEDNLVIAHYTKEDGTEAYQIHHFPKNGNKEKERWITIIISSILLCVTCCYCFFPSASEGSTFVSSIPSVKPEIIPKEILAQLDEHKRLYRGTNYITINGKEIVVRIGDISIVDENGDGILESFFGDIDKKLAQRKYAKFIEELFS